MVQAVFLFSVCVIAILYAGSRLSYYGDMLADVMGWGKMWMGMILMAGVTSLPELVTGVSSIQLVDSPGMAVGNVVGSCTFNILIISLLDVAFPRRLPVTYEAQSGHIIAAAFGVVLLCIVAMSIIQPGLMGSVGWVGVDSLLFIVIYFFAIRAVYNYEKRPKKDVPPTHEEQQQKSYSKTYIISRYLFFALLVVVAAIFLPYYGEVVAEGAGISEGIFGAVFLAFSTSLPEIVVSIMSVRRGSVDMAVGNVLGSNVFNIFVLAINDFVYTKGPLLESIDTTLLVPTIGTILITTIGIIGLMYKSKWKVLMAADTFVILIVYILMMKVMFQSA